MVDWLTDPLGHFDDIVRVTPVCDCWKREVLGDE